MSPPFIKTLDFSYGAADRLSPLVRRVVARNPSAFTFHGTGTYIVGQPGGGQAVIDPGPEDAAHLEALLAALEGQKVSHILITHTHHDHSPLTAALQHRTGAPSYAFGPHPQPRGVQAEEGGDHDFRPDHLLADGEWIQGDGWNIQALYTPGHISNHLCFSLAEEKALFSGDHVMGWSTTVISPPDGNMTQYYDSLEKLLPRNEATYYPTHGAPIAEASTGGSPQAFVRALINHRQNREAQIMAVLEAGPQNIPALVERMYVDVPKHLHRAAARSVLAHLIHMAGDGRVKAEPQPNEHAIYRRA